MMGWEVSSYVYGGQSYTASSAEEYTALAKALEGAAAEWRAASISWGAASLQLAQQCAGMTMCPASVAGLAGVPVSGHATLPYSQLIRRFSDHAAACGAIAATIDEMASLLIRAHSLYAKSELWTKRLFTELMQLITTVRPKEASLAMGILAAGGILGGSMMDGKFSPSYGSAITAPLQEGYLSGIAPYIGTIDPARPQQVDPLTGLLRTDEVNGAAGAISEYSQPADGLRQGTLHVTEVFTDVPVVGASSSVAQALEQLRRLAEERLGKVDLDSGLSYATIAVQRYRRDDGSPAWLVTIPGTDGKPDSPFGWPQNVELMSDDPAQRMKADSAMMVLEAMRQAGIGKDDPVALIGHSQGGITAAAIAADMSEEYTIEHVVTAGSPVANHPIPPSTWVTSIEIDDELVAALDGAANPATDTWLTVHGYAYPTGASSTGKVGPNGECAPGDATSSWNRGYRGAEVAGASDGKELTHWLKYHQAAYQNATDLGSPAVANHERHFRQVIEGELEETRYFQGRMSHDNE